MQLCDLCPYNTDTPLIIERNGQYLEVCWDCYQAYLEDEADHIELIREDR